MATELVHVNKQTGEATSLGHTHTHTHARARATFRTLAMFWYFTVNYKVP
jgi:hypothetical protein